MRKITFLLALLFTFVGVVPSTAQEDYILDESKVYSIKFTDDQSNEYYIYSEATYVTYNTSKSFDEKDKSFHFKFSAAPTTKDGHKAYYIKSVSTEKYLYSRSATNDYQILLQYVDNISTNKFVRWIVQQDGDALKIVWASNTGGSYYHSNYFWNPSTSESPISVNYKQSKNFKIEEVNLSGDGDGEEGGDTPEVSVDYGVNFDTNAKSTNRRFETITLNSPKFGNQSVSPNGYYIYSDKTSTTFKIEAGEEVSISATPLSEWIFGYVYIDTDNNGFTAGVDGYLPTGDMVSYSFYGSESNESSGYNSKGDYIEGTERASICLPPSFNAPTVPGTYRMRIKFDWNSIDPKGDNNNNFGGTITTSAISGTIVDVMVEVVEPEKPKLPVTLAQITDDDNLLYGLSGYITTFSAPYATTIPGDVTAYYAQEVGNSEVISLTELSGGVVPANFGVVLVGNAATATMEPTDVSTETPKNAFSHSASGRVELGENCYVLANGQDGKGLYLAKTGLVLPANKAYLQLPASSQTSAFRFVVGETTAIQSVATENANTSIYDLSGRRVFSTTKGGVYIQNGKKFIVK